MKVSNWNKWDLHIHTPASNIMIPGDYKNPQYNASNIVDKLRENNVKLAVITDHHIFDKNNFNNLITEVKKCNEDFGYDITILPGVEINVKFTGATHKSIHFILIFENDKLDEIEKVINDLNNDIGVDIPLTEKSTIEQIVNRFAKFEYIVIPHLVNWTRMMERPTTRNTPICDKIV